MIDAAAQLSDLVPRVREAAWFALDTEADSLHSYPEKLCLLQISFPDNTLLVDPLAGLDLADFWKALAGKEIILHGGDYDLRLLFRSAHFVPTKVFDTMIAARLLGIKEFGLNSLLQAFLGLTLEKGSQKANWSMRPLTERMIKYALADAHYLKPLADALRARLQEAGRLPWHAEECAQLIRECAQNRPATPDEDWRIRGADRLDRRGLGVLRELWCWREKEAIASNRPPFFVLAHETMVAIAARAGAGEGVDGLIPRRYSPRRQEGVVDAVRAGLALSEAQLPHRRKHRTHRLSVAQLERLEELRRRRDAAANRHGLDPSLIASKSTLNELARDWDTECARLLPWQREVFE